MMIKQVVVFFILCFTITIVYGQNIQKRLILIGDAGEINHKQSSLISKASESIIKDSTLVFFLGDNIYPDGMALSAPENEQGMLSLQSQFEPFRENNVPVFFMAGNHDWNVSRIGGLEKLKAQEAYLNGLQDKNVHFVPEAGEPGPVSVNISESFEVILYDSEYWLYPYHHEDIDLESKRTTFIEKLKELVDVNKDKTLLVLSHHPMITYGEHSLLFGWKQHIFPLTRVNKYLYVPLPIVGSIFPLWRGHFFKSAEDLPSKAYQELIRNVSQAVGDHKNLLFVAGHDHGLQYIDNGSIRQVVSGSGSKSSFIVSNDNLKFKYPDQGFCIADCMDNGTVVLSYFIIRDSNTIKAFETVLVKK